MDGGITSIRSQFEVQVSLMHFKQVPRSENNHVDFLANLTSVIEYQFWREILIEYNAKPSIQQLGGEMVRLDTIPGWRDPLVAYLNDEVLPNDRVKA